MFPKEKKNNIKVDKLVVEKFPAVANFHDVIKGWGQNMDQGSMDPLFGRGPWTTFMDQVHGFL